MGVMQAKVVEAACRYPDVFQMDSSGMISMHPSLKTYEERSARINHVLTQWKEERLFVTLKGWRNEVVASLSIINFIIITLCISLVLRSKDWICRSSPSQDGSLCCM